MAPMTYSLMGTAWMPLAVVIVMPDLSTGASSSRSTPALVNWIQRRRGARAAMSSGTTGLDRTTSVWARMASRLRFASSGLSSPAAGGSR